MEGMKKGITTMAQEHLKLSRYSTKEMSGGNEDDNSEQQQQQQQKEKEERSEEEEEEEDWGDEPRRTLTMSLSDMMMTTITTDSFSSAKIVVNASIHPLCWILSCPILHFGFCPYQTTLTFGRDEVIRRDVAVCGQNVLEMPYGELGEVETSRFLCLTCVDSGVGTLLPGMGCDNHEQATHVAQLLKQHLQSRAVARQVQLAETILSRTEALQKKLELIEQYIQQQQQQQTILPQQKSVETQSMQEDR